MKNLHANKGKLNFSTEKETTTNTRVKNSKSKMEFEKPVVLSAEQILDVGNDFKWVPLSENRYMLNPTANMSSALELKVYNLMQSAASSEVPAHSLSVNLNSAPQEVWDALAEKANPQEQARAQFEKFSKLVKLEEAERLFLVGAASAPTHDPLALTRRLRSLGLSLRGTHKERQTRLQVALQRSIPESTVDSLLAQIGTTGPRGLNKMSLGEKHARIGQAVLSQELSATPFGEKVYTLHHSPTYQRPNPLSHSEEDEGESKGEEGDREQETVEEEYKAHQARVLDDATKQTPELMRNRTSEAKSFMVDMEKFRLARYNDAERVEQMRQVLVTCGFAPFAVEEASQASLYLALETYAKRNVGVREVKELGFDSVHDWVAAW